MLYECFVSFDDDRFVDITPGVSAQQTLSVMSRPDAGKTVL
jgi:hypothetical protein